MAKVREIEFFEHVAGALVNVAESDKLDRIRAIEKSGKAVEHFVLRHGLTERAAFEVEAPLLILSVSPIYRISKPGTILQIWVQDH